MIQLFSQPFKVTKQNCSAVEWVIENYFDCIQYEWDDGYGKDYKEYILNTLDEDYFDFTTQVSLTSFLIKGNIILPKIDKNNITYKGELAYIDLSYILSLLIEKDIEFYEINMATMTGRKTTLYTDNSLLFQPINLTIT